MRLTQAELHAVLTALGFILAGEPAESAAIDDEEEGERFVAALESAQGKLVDELHKRKRKAGV